jgi:hypothetical protein
MNARWILMTAWLAWTGVGVGQEGVLVADPFAEEEVETVDDPFAVAKEAGAGCVGCESCGEPDPFAAEDTDREAGTEDDPFAPDWAVSGGARKIPVRRAKEVRQTVRVRAETWEADAEELMGLFDGMEGPDGIDALRKVLMGRAQLVFSPVLAVDVRSRAEVEAITEQIYPTEYEGCGGLSSPLEEQPKPEEMTPIERIIDAVGSQALPTAFETRNTGLTFVAAVQPVEAEAGTWDISVSLEDVRQLGVANYGAEELVLKMPIFSNFRTGGLLRVEEGEWQLLSALEPARENDGKPTGKRWVTIVRVDRAR